MTHILVIYFLALNGDVTHVVKSEPMARADCHEARFVAEFALGREDRMLVRCARNIEGLKEWAKP